MQVVLTDPKTEPLWESQRQLNRDQAEQLRLLVDYVESFLRETESIAPELMRTKQGWVTVESAAVMNAAEALSSSEGHVFSQYHQACFARQHLPKVWSAVRAGHMPVRSLTRVVAAAERLVSPVHRERLDAEAAAYAVMHRPARLNAWLNRFVARMEPEHHAHRCRRGHAERRVWLEHLEDGVSLLHAMLPTLTAEAIKNRLVDVARSPKQDVPYDPCVEGPVIARPEGVSTQGAGECATKGFAGGSTGFDWLGLPSDGSDDAWAAPEPASAADLRRASNGLAAGVTPAPTSREAGDPRTQAQREADLVAHWLLTGETGTGTAINAHVGVLISPESLIGDPGRVWASPAESASPAGALAPAVSRSRRHSYPAEMIRRIVLSDDHQITWTPVPAAGVAPEPEPMRRPQPRPEPEPEPAPEPRGPALDPPERVYRSRFVPKLLRRLIEFRDGTCQAPGCMVAAEHCDIDHQIPWPHGQTTAANLWALCRKHHRLKTAGFLDVPPGRLPWANP